MNTVEIAPEPSTLAIPEIPVTDTPFAVLESGTQKQAHGTWHDEQTGASCILQVAFNQVNEK